MQALVQWHLEQVTGLAADAHVDLAQVPNVSRQEFSVLDISEDGFVSRCTLLTLSATLPCHAQNTTMLKSASRNLYGACCIGRVSKHRSSGGALQRRALHHVHISLASHSSCMQVSLMDADGNTKDDLKLPGGTDEAEKLADTIQAEFAAGKELTVVVLKAMGELRRWQQTSQMCCA
jgi:Eukaryotic elongation factor 5A hypusine, DNA-binding OB fold